MIFDCRLIIDYCISRRDTENRAIDDFRLTINDCISTQRTQRAESRDQKDVNISKSS